MGICDEECARRKRTHRPPAQAFDERAAKAAERLIKKSAEAGEAPRSFDHEVEPTDLPGEPPPKQGTSSSSSSRDRKKATMNTDREKTESDPFAEPAAKARRKEIESEQTPSEQTPSEQTSSERTPSK